MTYIHTLPMFPSVSTMDTMAAYHSALPHSAPDLEFAQGFGLLQGALLQCSWLPNPHLAGENADFLRLISLMKISFTLGPPSPRGW